MRIEASAACMSWIPPAAVDGTFGRLAPTA